MILDISTKEMLQSMFSPKQYSPQKTYKILMDYGGISSLINDLGANHRMGLSSYKEGDFERRQSLYGKNQQPPGESLLKKSIFEQRDFMVNLLFYILTLRVCVQLLLLRDIKRGLDPLNGEEYTLRIQDQFISFILLAITIILKGMVNVEYFNFDQNQRKYRNQSVSVKRDGEEIRIMERQLMVGDILIVQKNSKVRVDGIILKCENLLVNEAKTILRQQSKTKISIWNISEDNLDSFVLAGTTILTGRAQILIATVGQNCSFRIKKSKQNGIFSYQSSPMISQLKTLLEKLQTIARSICVFIPTYLSIAYLIKKSNFSHENLVWLDFLYILRLYSSFLGFFHFLQRLKILKSLQFFLEGFLSGKYFIVKNKGSLEKISGLDILFIEGSAISITKSRQRNELYYTLDHVGELSIINSFFNVKIITNENKEKIYEIFGDDIPEKQIYQPSKYETPQENIEMLKNATFITSCTSNHFIKNYIPFYQSLNYQIGYISNALNKRQERLPKDILHFSFHQLELDQQLAPKIHESRNSDECWIKLQNKIVMQDVLKQIILKSFVFAKLYNTYLSLFVNNILVFSILCWRSIEKGQIFNLYWSLMIIIINRYTFFTVYRRVALQSSIYSQRRISIREILKLNIFLLPYYLYVGLSLQYKSNIFVFFLANSLFRVETLLFRIHPRRSLRSLLPKGLIFLMIILLSILYKWSVQKSDLSEEIRNLGYLFGLILIFIGYIFIL